jgi:hypothetical protein
VWKSSEPLTVFTGLLASDVVAAPAFGPGVGALATQWMYVRHVDTVYEQLVW